MRSVAGNVILDTRVDKECDELGTSSVFDQKSSSVMWFVIFEICTDRSRREDFSLLHQYILNISTNLKKIWTHTKSFVWDSKLSRKRWSNVVVCFASFCILPLGLKGYCQVYWKSFEHNSSRSRPRRIFLSHTIGLFTKKDLLSASHTDSFTASTDNLFWESGNPDTTHV